MSKPSTPQPEKPTGPDEHGTGPAVVARREQIRLRRRELFLQTLAGPVADAADRWWAGWLAFGDDLRAGRREYATARLRDLAGQLREFQSLWEAWETARAHWFQTQAAPWNAEADRFRCGRFGPDGFSGDRDDFGWQQWLPWHAGGPITVPEWVVDSRRFEEEENRPGRDELFPDLRAVYVGLTTPDRAAELVAGVRNPARAADLAPVVGLSILPAPDLVTRWADGPPPGTAVQDARRLFRAAPDFVCHRLREEVGRRLATPPDEAAPYEPPWGDRAPIGLVREYLRADELADLDGLHEALGRLPGVEHTLATDRELLAGFDHRADGDVRLALLLWDDLPERLARLESIDAALGHSYRVESPYGLHSRSAAELLETDSFQVYRLLSAARALDEEYRSFAAAGARVRGVLGPGQPLTDDALRELRVLVRTPGRAFEGDPPRPPQEAASEVDDRPDDPPAEPDGPFGTDGFRYRGVAVEFGRAALQYQLVLALWDAGACRPAPARSAEDVMAAVWGEEHDTEDYQLRQLCGDVRGRFDRAGCPAAVRVRQGKVQLVPLPE